MVMFDETMNASIFYLLLLKLFILTSILNAKLRTFLFERLTLRLTLHLTLCLTPDGEVPLDDLLKILQRMDKMA